MDRSGLSSGRCRCHQRGEPARLGTDEIAGRDQQPGFVTIAERSVDATDRTQVGAVISNGRQAEIGVGIGYFSDRDDPRAPRGQGRRDCADQGLAIDHGTGLITAEAGRVSTAQNHSEQLFRGEAQNSVPVLPSDREADQLMGMLNAELALEVGFVGLDRLVRQREFLSDRPGR